MMLQEQPELELQLQEYLQELLCHQIPDSILWHKRPVEHLLQFLLAALLLALTEVDIPVAFCHM